MDKKYEGGAKTKLNFSLYFNSDPETGAYNINSTNSSFTVNFDNPLRIDRNVRSARCYMSDASFWNSVSNIVEGVNNQVKVHFGGTDYSVNLSTGIYDVAQLNSSINSGLVNLNAALNGLFFFDEDFATGKLVAVTPDATSFWYFTSTPGFENNIGPLVGFTADTPPADLRTTGDTVANFGDIQFVLIHSDLVKNGIVFNGKNSQIVGFVPLAGAPPGDLSFFDTSTPDWVSMNHLIGKTRKVVNFWVTDQRGNQITIPDLQFWSFMLQFELIY